jgi:hypothetical protein
VKKKPPKNLTPLRSGFRFFLAAIILSSILYAGGALLVFDFSQKALPFGEEHYKGRDVAFGPRPRPYFCTPRYGNYSFGGDEWALTVYRPVCLWWVKQKGYEVPQEWRSKGNK